MDIGSIIAIFLVFFFIWYIMGEELWANWKAAKAMMDSNYVSYSCDKCGYSGTREELREHVPCDNIILVKEGNNRSKRKTIPQNVKDKVWNRDNGKCVECGSNENLEFDHIIPVSKGGANTYRNLQLLCEHCNRSKSDKIG